MRNRNQLNRELHPWYHPINSFILWLIFLPLSMLNAFGLFNFINLLIRQFFPSRVLTVEEVRKLERVFANSQWYQLVRVRENSKLAVFAAKFNKYPHLGFVFCNTIHFSRNIQTALDNDSDMAWLVHEYIHIIQFHQLGIVYIPMALRAQKNGGYNYELHWLASPLKAFNLEQQGEVAKAYFQALNNNKDLSLYQSILPYLKAGIV